MSPRAAWRLEQYGFTEVYDYELGKNDWLAFALPHQGDAELVAGVVRDVPTCAGDERVASLAARLDGDGIGGVVVVNDLGVVLGLVPQEAIDAGGDARAEDVLVEGPTTVRPAEDVSALRHRMDHAGTDSILVTRPDGVLVGAFFSDDG